jgi:hypothetical protein
MQKISSKTKSATSSKETKSQFPNRPYLSTKQFRLKNHKIILLRCLLYIKGLSFLSLVLPCCSEHYYSPLDPTTNAKSLLLQSHG